MSKIICDICGTTYPDTADCCPICGCSRDSAMELLGEDYSMDQAEDSRSKKGRYSAKKRREIFDYDEVNPQLDETETLEEDLSDDLDQEADEPRSNTFAVIGMTILIAALLLAAAFLAVRYILPNLRDKVPASTQPVQVQDTLSVDPTEYAIPCQMMTLLSGSPAILNQEGQYFLLSVTVSPENTTDKLTFVSADESIATVTEDGRITAVSEGETSIYITCGNAQSECKVIVSYQEETLPPTEQTLPATEAAETAEAPEQTEPAEETAAAAQPTAGEKAPAADKDVTLKLKKTDIMLKVYLGCTLELDCGLTPGEVEWSVEHPHIASVDETGFVKALKTGTTDIIVKYGDQEVRCKIRCYK